MDRKQETDRKLKTRVKQKSDNHFRKPYPKDRDSTVKKRPPILNDDEMVKKCSMLEKSVVPSNMLKFNLPNYKITNADINKVFKIYGEIRQMYNNRKENFAVILYDNLEDSMCAFRESKYPGIMLDDTDLKLTYIKDPGTGFWPERRKITRKDFGYPSNPRDSDDENYCVSKKTKIKGTYRDVSRHSVEF